MAQFNFKDASEGGFIYSKRIENMIITTSPYFHMSQQCEAVF